jgi:hypothetical protein
MKRRFLLLLVLLPAVLLVGLDARAHFLISTWDLRPGAPQAPLAERVVVVLYHWVVRLAPFLFIALVLTAFPLAILFGGRRLAKATSAQTLRADSLAWSALATVTMLASVPLSTLLVGLVAPAWAWVVYCLWVIAAANTYALLVVSKCRLPGVVVFVLSLFSGPVGVFVFNVALWAWGVRTRWYARAV